MPRLVSHEAYGAAENLLEKIFEERIAWHVAKKSKKQGRLEVGKIATDTRMQAGRKTIKELEEAARGKKNHFSKDTKYEPAPFSDVQYQLDPDRRKEALFNELLEKFMNEKRLDFPNPPKQNIVERYWLRTSIKFTAIMLAIITYSVSPHKRSQNINNPPNTPSQPENIQKEKPNSPANFVRVHSDKSFLTALLANKIDTNERTR